VTGNQNGYLKILMKVGDNLFLDTIDLGMCINEDL